MEILILGEFFDPEPTLKGLAFAKALAAEGHKVEVLTGFPNYPGGKLYPGFRMHLAQTEIVDGIRIHRVPLFPSHDRSAGRRMLTYLSFALSASLIGPWLVRRPDVLYVYHPPLTISLPAFALKTLMRCPVVLDIQDLWPDTLGATGMVSRRWIIGFIERWALAMYRMADRIVVLSPGFRSKLIERGVPHEKVRVIYNWNEESRQVLCEPDLAFADTWNLDGKFKVMFAGSLGPAQALDTVLDAAKLCKEGCPDAQFIFVGSGVDSDHLRERVSNETIANVRFVPQQPMSKMGGILPLADALLVHLRNDPLFSITIPSKTQAYLAAGVPILMAASGDAAELVCEANAGPVIPPEDPVAMAAAIADLAGMPSERRAKLGLHGRRFYERKLSMAVGLQKFLEVFEEAHSGAAEPDQPAYLGASGKSGTLYLKYGKRAVDLAIVIPVLIILAPVFLVLSLISLATMGWPVFFRQRRAGRHGVPFTIYKFRSMTNAKAADGTLLPDAQRIPKFGAFLRRSSLDELPGLINVLLGDMSLVGPRPLLPEYLPYYTYRHARRHEVPPGITGPAQINGRQLALFSARMEMDVWYVENVSLRSDLELLCRTVPRVLQSRGVVVGQEVQEVDDLGLSQGLRKPNGLIANPRGTA